ncbi:MAG: helix-turn-helix domain-containing protein, partial [Salibacteraceae bacterium]
MSYDLSPIAQITADYINTTDRPIFLTGKAGTGKTTFLKHIVAHTHKKTIVAAPTGIAAINAGGVTLHSLLQLPFGAFIPERVSAPNVNAQFTTLANLFSNLRFNATKRNLIQEVELLIIDEVSMLRADLLDCIDHTLRFLRQRRYEAFGGLQVLFIGDLMQLPPVVKENEWSVLSTYYKSSFFFEAHALRNNPPIHVELDKVYRQSDEQFIQLLNRFRENQQTPADIALLNTHYREDYSTLSNDGYIHLTTHNRKADEMNAQRLSDLATPTFTFGAIIEGEYPENLYATASEMELKESAQVMFIKNDPTGTGRFFNGKIGQISSLSADCIQVRFENGDAVEVPRYTWENKRYTLHKTTNEIEEKVLGTFEQYPLKLAWAVTVHKSQGLTFEKAILDLSGAFAQGQIYVALSRLTSIEGLVLSSQIPTSGHTLSESLKQFIQTQSSVDQLSESITDDRKTYLAKHTLNAFHFVELMEAFRLHEQSFDKQENRSAKQKHLPWTKNRVEELTKLQVVGDGFMRQVQRIVTTEADYLPTLTERVKKATDYFTPILKKCGESIQSHSENLENKSKLKTYRKELAALEQLVYNKTQVIVKANLLLQFALQEKTLSRQDVEKTSEGRRKRKPTAKKSAKKDKTPTAEVSFKLHQEGMTIDEIAEKRGLVPTTIEGHLCQYVATGEMDPYHLLDKEKLDKMLSVITPEME